MLSSKRRAQLPNLCSAPKLRVELLEDRLQPGSVLSGWGFSLLGPNMPELEAGVFASRYESSQLVDDWLNSTRQTLLSTNLALLTPMAAGNSTTATNVPPTPPAQNDIGRGSALPSASDFVTLDAGSLNVPVSGNHFVVGQTPVSAGPQATPVLPQSPAGNGAAFQARMAQPQAMEHLAGLAAMATPIPSAAIHPITVSVVAHVADSQTGISPYANLYWTTYVSGTTGAGTGRGVAVDSSGNVFTTGYTDNGMTKTAFVAEYNLAGKRLAFTAFQVQDPSTPTYSQSEGHAVAVDNAGGVYVVGKATNTALGTTDAFIMKFDAANQLMPVMGYGVGIGVSFNDSGEGVAVDAAGEATITGTFQPTANETDIFAAKFPVGGGSPLFATFFSPLMQADGTLIEADSSAGNAIALDSTGMNAYLAGSVHIIGGDNDILIMEIDNTRGTPIYALTTANPGDDALTGIAVDQLGQAYVVGTASTSGTTNAYVAEVSAGGSMTNPSIINPFVITLGQTGTGIARDPGTGDIYVVGSGPPGASVYHAFVEKYDSTLKLHDLAYTSGSGSDLASGVAYDPTSGSAYIVGTATSTDLATDGTTLNGTSDAFLSNVGSFG